jgi:hypothetical protein
MPMAVMGVRHVRMAVPPGIVAVEVAVGADRHRIVPMVVMTVVVGVRVLMLQRLVFMLVLV